jgi:putative flippase GtrA
MSGARQLPARGLRFAGVAALGLLVQLAVLVVLVRTAAVSVATATAAAVAVTVVHNYGWHERWTWGDRPATSPRARAARFARFVAVTGSVSIAGNVGLTVLLAEGLQVPVLLANVTAVTVLGVANFCAAHLLVFVRHDARLRAPSVTLS